jgi:small-conductance mechanosensitive channel
VSPTLAPTLGPDDSSASSRLQAAQDDQAALLATNERLQRYIRSVLDLRQKGAGAGDNSLGTAQARYTSLRQRLLEHRAMLNATEQHYERLTDSLREQLQTRLAKATSIQNVRHCAANLR